MTPITTAPKPSATKVLTEAAAPRARGCRSSISSVRMGKVNCAPKAMQNSSTCCGHSAVIEVRDGGPDLQVPEGCDYVTALDAAVNAPADFIHPCPGCFVCGPARAAGDGLRLSAGSVPGREIVATPWVPAQEFALADGKIAPQIIAAAMDCPGYMALRSGGAFWLLGEYSLHIDRRVHPDEACVITGWELSRRGRVATVGTALYDEAGLLCAVARGTWVQPRSA